MIDDQDPIMPVDSEERAMELRPLSFAVPHMRAFHLAWLSLFSCFFSAFSVPPLLPVLGANPSTGVTSGVVSLSATFVVHLVMGPLCDLLGPRRATAILSLVTGVMSIVLALLSASASHNGLILLRFMSGLSLGNFVANQYWMTSMFSPSVVGLANAVAAGWANMGSGVAQVIMPLAYSFLLHIGVMDSMAGRVVFLLPAGLQIVTALAALYFAQDFPQGDFSVVRKKKKIQKRSIQNFWEIVKEGVGDYRSWILALTYGYCYGVELTIEAVIATFFRERFKMGMEAAGVAAACFGLINIVSRPIGGMASDELGENFGMRGRLWGLWLVQTIGGVMCFLLGRVSDEDASLGLTVVMLVVFAFFVQAASGLTFGVVPFVSGRALGVVSGMTASGGVMGAIVMQLLFFSGTFRACSAAAAKLLFTWEKKNSLRLNFFFPTRTVIFSSKNSLSLPLSLSLSFDAAEHAVSLSMETSISLMGLMIMIGTLPLMLVYFPKLGGMLCAPLVDYDVEADYVLLK